jgi:hypothetical protein
MNAEEFEVLQKAKVERAQRLLNITSRIGAAEMAGEKEVLEKGLHILADHMPLLVEKIRAQQKLCGKDNQCIALIDQELQAFAGRNRQLGVSIIDHVKQAAKGLVSLQVVPVTQALIMIISREKSLKQLYSAAA